QNCFVSTDKLVTHDPPPSQNIPTYGICGYYEAQYGGLLSRLAANFCVSCQVPGPTACTWDGDVRHHYSKDQPWNANGTILALYNHGYSQGCTASPNPIYLDGST